LAAGQAKETEGLVEPPRQHARSALNVKAETSVSHHQSRGERNRASF
jgi:hypothetical protein